MRHKVLSLVSLIVLLAMLVTGCAPAATPSPAATSAPAPTSAPAATVAPAASPVTSPAAAQSKQPLKMGLIGNMGWPVAAEAVYAAKLAVDEVNKAGGILGRPIELLIEDSKGQAPAATAAYKKLVMNDKVTLVMIAEGTEINMACQEAGADLYPEYKHIAMNTCTSHQELGDKVKQKYDRYKFYFRPFSTTEAYVQFLTDNANMMNHYVGAKTVALIVEDAQWTEYFRKGLPGKYPPFKEVIKETGVEVVYYAETATGEKMFLPIFEAAAAKNPDYIFYLCAYSDTTIFVKQWAQSAASDIDLYSNGGQSTMPEFFQMTGGAALGVVTPTYGALAALSERTIPFIKALKSTYDKSPNWVSYSVYDVPYLMQAAADKAGTSEDIEALIKALETVEIAGVAGLAAFDDSHSYKWGAPYMDAARAQIQENGEFAVLFPFDVAKESNPDRTFIPVKDLRAKAGQ